MKPRLLRITTVPISFHYLLRGQLSFMKEQGFEVIAISADGKERQQILDEGIQHHIIPFTRKITPVLDFIALINLIWLIRKLKPQIVHTHTPKAGLLGMIAAWFCSVPVRLHTVAGLPMMEANGLKRWVLKITERVTYRCANRIYPNSKGLLSYILSEFQISNLKFEIIGRGSSNGIDTRYFSRTEELDLTAKAIRKQYDIPETSIVFSFIGRVVRDKGISELVKAFKKLIHHFPDCYLLLVGPLEQELDPISDEDLEFLNFESNIIMPGFQHDVRPWLLASDIFILPSYREGFPNVVMQAACMEVPCIVSDINGCNEIITHEHTGLIVPPKDADAVYYAMKRLVENPDQRSALGKNSRAFVTAHFDQHYIWDELLTEYKKRLEGNLKFLI